MGMRVQCSLPVLLVLVFGIVLSLAKSANKVYYVPSNAQTGHVVTVLPLQDGQQARIQDTEEYAWHKLFTILGQGQLITTSNLSSLGGGVVSLTIQHRISSSSEIWEETLAISIEDSDRSIQFEKQPYEGYILENEPNGTPVQELEELKYSISRLPYGCTVDMSGDDALAFELKLSPEPQIVARSSLDRELVDKYYILLEVRCPIGVAHTMIRVHVLDVNDNGPKLSQSIYSTMLQDRVVSLQIQGSDADKADNLQYYLEEDGTPFHLDSQTGILSMKGDGTGILEQKTYFLHAYAKDVAGHRSPSSDIYINQVSELESDMREKAKSRSRRAVRTERVYAVRHDKEGQLFWIPKQDDDERFAFSGSVPENLAIDEQLGIVSRPAGHQWDSEAPVVTFTLNVTRESDADYLDQQPITLHVLERTFSDAIFSNEPLPLMARIPVWIRPGTVIYTVAAVDAASPYDQIVEYVLESGGDGKFEVDAGTGEVLIVGRQQFEVGRQYHLAISAIPRDVIEESSMTPAQVLTVQVDDILPQFYMDPRYDVYMSERTEVNDEVVQIKVVSFQELPVRFTLKTYDDENSELFRIEPVDEQSAEITLLRKLRHNTDIQEYRLKVTAKEDISDLESTTDVVIHLVGENENDPFFPSTMYVARDIAENIGSDQEIMRVEAIDLDLGDNGYLEFEVSDDHFKVETGADRKTAIIRTNKELDYDWQPDHMYQFTLTAHDLGQSERRSATTSVQVWVTNVDDELPHFAPELQVVKVKERCPPNTLIYAVQAFDPDGRGITSFMFRTASGFSSTTQDIFRIDNDGLIYLTQDSGRSKQDIELQVLATNAFGTKEGTVFVQFIGINTPPVFKECSSIQASVPELMGPGYSVVNITATDEDSGTNGKIDYTVVWKDKQLFDVRQHENPDGTTTAEIYTLETFDREQPDRGALVNGDVKYRITVQATDEGIPPLSTTCFFFVEISDTNDNLPVFDLNDYRGRILRSQLDAWVVRVFATDDDAGDNANIEYSIVDDTECPGCFQIDQATGVIRTIGSSSGVQQDRVTIRVRAQDTPSSALGSLPPQAAEASVFIELTDDASTLPPSWLTEGGVPLDDLLNVVIAENATQLTRLDITPRAQTAPGKEDQKLILHVQRDRTLYQNSAGDFTYETKDDDVSMDILVGRLDYGRTPEYSLRLSVSYLAGEPTDIITDARLRVNLIDVNNRAPEFEGLDASGKYSSAVSGETVLGEEVVKVTAVDLDGTSPNNLVIYSFDEDCGSECEPFLIDRATGVITANNPEGFKREEKARYTLRVIAEDGAPSAIRRDGLPNRSPQVVNIQVIGSTNDPAEFPEEEYTQTIPEAQEFNYTVATIVADNPEPDLNVAQYQIVAGNIDHAFGVDNDTGRIFVMGYLEVETQAVYSLTYRVFDGLIADETMVTISLSQRNLIPPRFGELEYSNDNAIEEGDSSVSPSNPKFITTVGASDADGGSDIEYGLEGPLAEEGPFTIDASTGSVYLTGPLERDYPGGYDPWTLTVTAKDSPTDGTTPTVGYALLQISLDDRNDNAPMFDVCCVEGTVMEDQSNAMALTLQVMDYDEGSNSLVTYEALDIPKDPDTQQELFTLNSISGEIRTVSGTAGRLDREEKDVYEMVVRAQDQGNPSLTSPNQTIWITVEDADDNAPFFSSDSYQKDVDENLPVGSSIISLTATDNDVGENAALTYSVQGGADSDYFYVDSVANVGVLKVQKVIDYDTMNEHSLTVAVRVEDALGISGNHYDDTTVTIEILDVNDNAPIFKTSLYNRTLPENTALDTEIVDLEATDSDTGENANFEYYVDYENTDPGKLFAVSKDSGRVTLRNSLDYETKPEHTVHILAVDKGLPAQTGTATLMVTVTDINDNAPQLRNSPVIEVPEGLSAGDVVAKFYIDDSDSDDSGPPQLEAECNTAECSGLTLRSGSDSLGDFGELVADGSVTSGSKVNFPITIGDNVNAPGSPNARTVTISLEVDGPPPNTKASEPGIRDIEVYNFARNFPDTEIGYVYFDDEDGWNPEGKEYKFVDDDHDFFDLSESDAGMLIMERGAPRGEHEFSVEVSDSLGSAICTVRVTVTYIEPEHVRTSGSMRLTASDGLTNKQFVARDSSNGLSVVGSSMYDKLRDELASLLDTASENVEIFTVRNVESEPEWDTTQVDVIFAAHGSPYYRSSRLDGLVWANKDRIEAALGNGVEVLSSPVDPCSAEICYGDGCHSQLVISDEPLLVHGDSNSLVGVDAYYTASCTCGATSFSSEPERCEPDTCLNNGTCTEHWNGYDCTGCPEGYEGPNCELLKLSFAGDGWAWVEPLSACKDGKTSFEIITNQADSLLLYAGPMYQDTVSAGQTDFLSVELRGGKPRLRVDLGSGPISNDGLEIPNGQRLDDGQWHTIEVFKEGMDFRLVVDHCDTANVNENIDLSVSDRASCEAHGTAPGDDYLLNVKEPLQLGGRGDSYNYPSGLTRQSYNGCMKNLRHNGVLYDLEVMDRGQYAGTISQGCPEELGCNDCRGNSTCIGSFGAGASQCICDPGFTGADCTEETTVRDFFEENSYIEWDIKEAFNNTLSQFVSEFQMMFRTRQNSGMLFMSASFSTLEHLKIEVVNTILTCRYDLGSGDEILDLPYVNVSDGRWHSVRVSRHGNQVVLKLDGGQGKQYAESFPTNLHRWIFIKNAYGAANLYYKKYHVDPDVSDDITETCVTDVRYRGDVFPLQDSDSQVSATIRRIEGDREGCDPNNPCSGVDCPGLSQCQDYWRMPYCLCPLGYVLDGSACIAITDCSVSRCSGHGDCVMLEQGASGLSWFCHCWDGWTGANCNDQVGAVSDDDSVALSTAALVIILLCLLLLIILVLLAVWWIRRRKPEYLLGVDPEDDIRENVVIYDEEGAGEEDMHGYDLSRLRKPVGPDSPEAAPYGLGQLPPDAYPRTREELPRTAPDTMSPPRPFLLPGDYPNVGDFIDDRLNGADDDPNAPPYDSVREYEYEGGGSDAGSLSSLVTSSSGDQDYDYLNDYGPPFKKLAELYGGGEEDASSV